MRPGVSRVVVEIVILVIAVALALLIFSPISSYLFGSISRVSYAPGASSIQILAVDFGSSNTKIYVKNLGPRDFDSVTSSDFLVFIDNVKYSVSVSSSSWPAGSTITLTINKTFSTTTQHTIVVFGPGNTQAQYLFSP